MDLLRDFFNTRLFAVGASVVTPKLLAILFGLVISLIAFTNWVGRWGAARMMARRNAEPGAVHAVFQIVRYIMLVTGVVIIVQSVGIDLSALVVVVGTLGIGLGFALQPLMGNFISGLVLLLERPLKIGDRIELGPLAGRVVSIGARATMVRTNDNISVIVPNSELASSQIINWSHGERTVRITIPIGVSYRSDPEKVRDVLLEVAHTQAGVLREPVPEVLLDGFNDSSIDFALWVWTSEYLERPRVLRSELNFAIHAALKAHGIEIPFPQRDLHLRSIDPGATEAVAALREAAGDAAEP
ncbi:MAG: mechanosensitive ion channel [Kofleriaceae bacterium]